jgi:hypothetical protein
MPLTDGFPGLQISSKDQTIVLDHRSSFAICQFKFSIHKIITARKKISFLLFQITTYTLRIVQAMSVSNSTVSKREIKFHSYGGRGLHPLPIRDTSLSLMVGRGESLSNQGALEGWDPERAVFLKNPVQFASLDWYKPFHSQIGYGFDSCPVTRFGYLPLSPLVFAHCHEAVESRLDVH